MAEAPTVSGDTEIKPIEDYQEGHAKFPDLDHYEGNNFKEELMRNAKYLSTPGKGVLATDEQNSTCGKRIAAIGLDNTEENRRNWRDVLYTTPDLEKYCVGVIMYDETGR